MSRGGFEEKKNKVVSSSVSCSELWVSHQPYRVLLHEQLQVCFGAVLGIQELCQLQPNQLGCSVLKFGAGNCLCSAVPLAGSGEFVRGTCTPNSPCSAKSTDNGLAAAPASVLQAQVLQGTFLALCFGAPRKASVAGAVIYEVLAWAVTLFHT